MIGENTYSRLIGVLKIALPLAALALMSTVFLIARSPGQESVIPFAEIEDIAREPRLANAQLSGVAEDGSDFELTARRVRPSGEAMLVDNIDANITTPGGVLIHIRAGNAEIDSTAALARLSGLARLETSSGYFMETIGLTADFAQNRITTDGALEVQAPFGTLTAGQLTIETPVGSTEQVMLFQDGVRLLYTPQN